MRNGKLRKELDYVTDVSGKIIWEAHVQEVDSVISMAAKKPEIDYSMDKENGCKETHNRLLHGQRKVNTKGPIQDGNLAGKPPMKQMHSAERNLQEEIRGGGTKGDDNNQATTVKTSTDHDTRKIALRTIPVILKNGTRKVQVSCLLDERSDTTYINEDVLEELGLTGEKERIEVKVANNQTISFMSNTFTIGLESTDGRVDTEIAAKMSEKIYGGMKAVS